MKVSHVIIGVLIFMPQLVFAQIPSDSALEIVRRGIESHHVTHQEYLDASLALLKTAEANPKFITANKDVIIKEIEKLDQWDSFSDISGNYMRTLIKILMGLADPGLTKLFLRECKHGLFVAEGLANIGRPALDTILSAVGGKYSICAVTALGRMAEKDLTSNSNLSPDQRNILEEDFRNTVLPRLQDELTSSVARGELENTEIIRRTLANIKR